MTLRCLSLLCVLVLAGMGWRPSAMTGTGVGALPAACCCVVATSPLSCADHRDPATNSYAAIHSDCACTPAPLPSPDLTAIPHAAAHDFSVLLGLRLPLTTLRGRLVSAPRSQPADQRMTAVIAASRTRPTTDDAPLFVRYCSFLT